MKVIGWAYEADLHCWDCAIGRFPVLDYDDGTLIEDNEGNEVTPVFSIEEGGPFNCGDCHERLE